MSATVIDEKLQRQAMLNDEEDESSPTTEGDIYGEHLTPNDDNNGNKHISQKNEL